MVVRMADQRRAHVEQRYTAEAAMEDFDGGVMRYMRVVARLHGRALTTVRCIAPVSADVPIT